MNRMLRDQILDHQVNDEKSKKVEKKVLQSEKDNQEDIISKRNFNLKPLLKKFVQSNAIKNQQFNGFQMDR